MAGVYIKGARIPYSCVDCFMRKECFWHREEIAFLEFIHGRSRDCPLVEVSDHGDLVDRDAAPQLVAVLYTDVNGTVVNPTYKIDLSSLPVVIPADKEGV